MLSEVEFQTALIEKYQNLLLTTDAGQPSYSLDGESVSYNEWRASLLNLIKEARLRIIAAKPYSKRLNMSAR